MGRQKTIRFEADYNLLFLEEKNKTQIYDVFFVIAGGTPPQLVFFHHRSPEPPPDWRFFHQSPDKGGYFSIDFQFNKK